MDPLSGIGGSQNYQPHVPINEILGYANQALMSFQEVESSQKMIDKFRKALAQEPPGTDNAIRLEAGLKQAQDRMVMANLTFNPSIDGLKKMKGFDVKVDQAINNFCENPSVDTLSELQKRLFEMR